MTLLRVQPPTGGEDRTALPDTLGSVVGAEVINMLPGKPRLSMRQNQAAASSAWAVSPGGGNSGGYWVSGDALLQKRLTGGFSSGNVFSGITATIAAPAGYVGTNLSPSFAEMSGGVAGVSTGTLAWWDAAAASIVALTKGPNTAVAVATHQTRLFVLGGSVPNTTTPVFNNKLYWTDPTPEAQFATDALAVWQDDVTGLVNQLPLPSNDTWVDVVTFNRALYVLGTRSVLALTGDTPSTYALRKVLDSGAELGSAGFARATDRGIYFRSTIGVVRFDGVTATVIDRAEDMTACQIEVMGGGFLSFVTASTWYIFHEAAGAWGRLTSTVLTGGRPNIVRRTAQRVVAVHGGDGAAATVVMESIGTWIVPGTSAAALTSSVKSRTMRLASPTNKTMVRRVHAETFGGDWRITLVDPNNVADLSVVVGDTSYGGNFNNARLRTSWDVFREFESFYVLWTPLGNSGFAQSHTLTIGDVYIEYDAAQQR